MVSSEETSSQILTMVIFQMLQIMVQGFDGAANMSGNYSGVRSRII